MNKLTETLLYPHDKKLHWWKKNNVKKQRKISHDNKHEKDGEYNRRKKVIVEIRIIIQLTCKFN